VQVLDGAPYSLMLPRMLTAMPHLRRASPYLGSILNRDRNQVVMRRLASYVSARPKVLSV
jgi:hypothetical protein